MVMYNGGFCSDSILIRNDCLTARKGAKPSITVQYEISRKSLAKRIQRFCLLSMPIKETLVTSVQ